MRLLTFRDNSNLDRVGIMMPGGRILDLRTAAEAGGIKNLAIFDSMLALIESGEAGLEVARDLERTPTGEALRDLDAIKIKAPIPVPPRMRSGSLFARHLTQALEGSFANSFALQARPGRFLQESGRKCGSATAQGLLRIPCLLVSG